MHPKPGHPKDLPRPLLLRRLLLRLLLGRSFTPPGATWRRPRSTEHDQTRQKNASTEIRPGLIQSSQSTILELWASSDLPGPPRTQLDTSWTYLETPKKHRKQPDVTGKYHNQEVVPGLFQSSQATILELWASPELRGPPGTQLDTS